MKLIVDRIPKDKNHCPFYNYIHGDGYSISGVNCGVLKCNCIDCKNCHYLITERNRKIKFYSTTPIFVIKKYMNNEPQYLGLYGEIFERYLAWGNLRSAKTFNTMSEIEEFKNMYAKEISNTFFENSYIVQIQ